MDWNKSGFWIPFVVKNRSTHVDFHFCSSENEIEKHARVIHHLRKTGRESIGLSRVKQLTMGNLPIVLRADQKQDLLKRISPLAIRIIEK